MRMDTVLMQQILNAEPAFFDIEEKIRCTKLLDEMSTEECEELALSSYTYWLATFDEIQPDRGMQRLAALKDIRRHYIAENKKYDSTLERLRQTCRLRRDNTITVLRTLFADNFDQFGLTANQLAIRAEYQVLVSEELAKQNMVVRGYDRENRAILYKLSRTKKDTLELAYTLTQLYLIDRAAAASEVVSRGKQDQVVVVLVFDNYLRSLSPPLSTVRHGNAKLQTLFPERLHKLIVLNPPFWMRAIYHLISPLLSSATRQKIRVLSGKEEGFLREAVDAEQAMPMLRSDGHLISEISVDQYLRNIPYYGLYDGVYS
jgi:hypothetical protein